MRAVKGMVQVEGTTYRVVRLGGGEYEVVRLLDDRRVGTFGTLPPMRLTADAIDPTLMHTIAVTAIRAAKTSWVGRLSPV
jgi:hypothetical protein